MRYAFLAGKCLRPTRPTLQIIVQYNTSKTKILQHLIRTISNKTSSLTLLWVLTWLLLFGGSGEIRTHGTFRFVCFQDRCNKPDSATLPYWNTLLSFWSLLQSARNVLQYGSCFFSRTNSEFYLNRSRRLVHPQFRPFDNLYSAVPPSLRWRLKQKTRSF